MSGCLTKIGYLFLAFIALGVVANLVSKDEPGHIDNSAYNEPQKPIESKPVQNLPSTGQLAFVTLGAGNEGGVPFAISQDAYDRMNDLLNAQDSTGLGQMRNVGIIDVLETGTKCRVIHTGIFNYELRVEDGPHSGSLAFVKTGYVHKALD